MKTKLEWVVRGIMGKCDTRRARINTLHQRGENVNLEELFRQFYNSENFGTENSKPILAPEDQQALEVVSKGTRALKEGYEAPLPWREGNPK